MRVYLAGPILHSHDDGTTWRNTVTDSNVDVEWVNPLDSVDESDGVTDAETAREIVRSDKDDIRTCDCLLVKWEMIPTAGTPMEILFAYRHRIPVLTVWSGADEDLSPWVRYHSTEVVDSIPKALSQLEAVVGTV